MTPLVLRFHQSPGDEVVATAALRDLHTAHPGRFITGIESPCPALWEYNPHVHPVQGERIEMHYPLIATANTNGLHFIHAYRMFLEERLGLSIPQGPLHGDIHLCGEEREHPIEQPYWLINSGGKNDFTCKQWPHDRWQSVVNHFQGRIQFVQVGELSAGHIHPPLENVIDLRGQTDLRQLIRLVHHSEGVLCGVTMLMHLSAALPMPDGSVRCCVVVAGGREPPSWEQYHGHTFIHTVGQLPCNQRKGVPGGCWCSRLVPLGDGTWHDDPDRICSDVIEGVPHCMDLINVDQVCQAIEDRPGEP